MWELILAVGLAVGISALCSISEAVLYSVPLSHIENLRREGKASGEILSHLRSQIDRPIAAILTLNTVANTAGAAVAGAAAVHVFGPESLFWFSVVFTAAILIFSEILPKTLGVIYSRPLAQFLARPLKILVWVMTPVIFLSGLLMRFVRRTQHATTSEEDLRASIALASRTGGIKPYEALSMKNILTLDDKMVKDVMTPRTVIFTLPLGLTVGKAKIMYSDWPHSRMPVYDKDPDDIVGIVTRRRIFESLANHQEEATIGELMRPAEFILETVTLDKALVHFLGSRSHLAVVIDEYGGVAGVVTLEDVFEEILGREIVDETDKVADMREWARQKRKDLIQGMAIHTSSESGTQ